jgi:hypothetical protein
VSEPNSVERDIARSLVREYGAETRVDTRTVDGISTELERDIAEALCAQRECIVRELAWLRDLLDDGEHSYSVQELNNIIINVRNGILP